MAVRAQCPRCKQPLSVPNKLAGSYASCPRCQGRFWVSKDAPLDPSGSDTGGSALASALTLTQVPVAAPPVAGPPGRPGASSVSPVSGPAGPPPISAASTSAATLPPVPPRPYFPSVTPLAPIVELPAPPTAAAPPTTAAPRYAPPADGATGRRPPHRRRLARSRGWSPPRRPNRPSNWPPTANFPTSSSRRATRMPKARASRARFPRWS